MNIGVAQYWTILGGAMTVSGIIGNIISILVLRRKMMRSQNLNSFLLVQAVIDLGVVLTLLLRKWMGYTFQFDITDSNDFICKSLQYLSSGFVDMSSWNLVLTSLEKLMFVIRPLTSRVNRSMRCRRIKMAAVFSILAIYNIPSLIGYGIGNISNDLTSNTTQSSDHCCYNADPNINNNNRRNITNRNTQGNNNNNYIHTFLPNDNSQDNSLSGVSILIESSPLKASKNLAKCTHVSDEYTEFVEKYDNWIHIFVRIIVPAIIMMVCNIIIIRTISRRPLLDEIISSETNTKKTGKAFRRRIPPNTKLVVVVNLLFFITCAPVSINRIYDCFSGGYNSSSSYSYLRLLALSHHSVSFAFYMLSGQRFRKEFFHMRQEVYAFFGSCFESAKRHIPSISFELSVSKA